MSRSANPIPADRLIEVVLQMIAAHRGKPCPTRREITGWTGLSRARVWPYLKSLAECHPPLIEIQERLYPRGGRRRLRLPGGDWTLWTRRRTPTREDHAMTRQLEREERDG